MITIIVSHLRSIRNTSNIISWFCDLFGVFVFDRKKKRKHFDLKALRSLLNPFLVKFRTINNVESFLVITKMVIKNDFININRNGNNFYAIDEKSKLKNYHKSRCTSLRSIEVFFTSVSKLFPHSLWNDIFLFDSQFNCIASHCLLLISSYLFQFNLLFFFLLDLFHGTFQRPRIDKITMLFLLLLCWCCSRWWWWCSSIVIIHHRFIR